uniref:NADH dehydrogenase subunit 6 n=1 Tax=Gyge ovalis TaxID=2008693 RepID=A0A343DSC5_9CRUS|nr:NADH dehydrogenase subunit 6 [Gyge ovalis]ASC43032.1 NADH dehydrogenase subunit 6 [Gyge ovalis]
MEMLLYMIGGAVTGLLFSCNQPGPLVVMLLVDTLCLVHFIIYWGLFSWFGYILVLIFWGSMMVLFLYGVCLSPNLKPAELSLDSDGSAYLAIWVGIPLFGGGFYSTGGAKSLDLSSSLSVSLVSSSSVFLFLYSVCNLLLILLVVCEMAYTSKGPLLLMG